MRRHVELPDQMKKRRKREREDGSNGQLGGKWFSSVTFMNTCSCSWTFEEDMDLSRGYRLVKRTWTCKEDEMMKENKMNKEDGINLQREEDENRMDHGVRDTI